MSLETEQYRVQYSKYEIVLVFQSQYAHILHHFLDIAK